MSSYSNKITKLKKTVTFLHCMLRILSFIILIIFYFILYVFSVNVCMYVCMYVKHLCVSLFPLEIRKRHMIP